MVTAKDLDPSTTFDYQLRQATGPISLYFMIYVPREVTAEFLEVWRDEAAYMKAQPGCVSAHLHRGTGDSQLLLNIAVWESTEALHRAFIAVDFQKWADLYPEGVTVYPHIFEHAAFDSV